VDFFVSLFAIISNVPESESTLDSLVVVMVVMDKDISVYRSVGEVDAWDPNCTPVTP